MLEINLSALVIFLLVWILTYVFNTLLFKPVGKIIQERKQLTEGVKQDAEAVLQEAQDLLSEYHEKIASVKNQAYEAVKRHRQTFQKEKETAMAYARQEATQHIESALKDIETSLNAAKRDASAEAESIARLIVQQILQREIGSRDAIRS